jgi:hypothetical protein
MASWQVRMPFRVMRGTGDDQVRFSRIAALAVGLPVLLGGAVAGSAPAAVAAAALTQRPGPAVVFPHADLGGVAAVSGQLAWAVGIRSIGAEPHTTFQPLIMRWNGATWAQVPSPVLSAGGSLAGVAVTSAADAWAVGSSGGDARSPASRALIEHWDGTAWKKVAGPHPAGSALSGVAAVTAHSAWAVGTVTRRDGSCPCRALIEHWDGTTWKQAASPHRAGTNLFGVAAVSARSAWAVGDRGSRGVIEHWDGKAWKQAASPADASLFGVATVSARSAWAVGSHGHGEQKPSQALIEHWNGTAWKRAPSPATPDFASLSSVTALSADSAWAVGNFDGGGLIEHWDGTAWKLKIPGGPDSMAFSLLDVAATSAGNAWIAGLDGTHGGQGLILHWNGTRWH